MANGPIFSAVSSSARQIYLLLRCIAFTPKADVQVTSEGLRFSVEETRVSQGLAFLDKNLFSSYVFNPPEGTNTAGNASSQSTILPPFQISLTALLETLQIFGISDPSSNYNNRAPNFSSSNAFNTPALGLGGTCRLSYSEIGAPLAITLAEADVTTTCDLTTYEPSSDADEETIPLQRDALTLKVIMPSFWLAEAMAELSSTNPEVLVLTASSSKAPQFSMQGLGGPYGDSMVEYQAEEASRGLERSKPAVTEIFVVNSPDRSGRVKQRYRFELIKKAMKAMALASKVSVRSDRQGVLSLQFMIELNEGAGKEISGTVPGRASGKVSFIDYRFVPLLDDEDGDQDGSSTASATDSE